MRRCRLHILGASGSGTTTLARALASRWSVPHADADDYYWLPTDPPYVHPRPVDERLALMRAVFVGRDAWVLSGSMVGWGDPVVDEADALVLLLLAPEERMRRLEAREAIRHADRAPDPSAHRAFLDWARRYDDPGFDGRSRTTHERWLKQRPQPVLRLDSAAPPEALVDQVLAWDPER